MIGALGGTGHNSPGSLLVASSTMLKLLIMMFGDGIVLLSILVSMSFQKSVFSFGVFGTYTASIFMLLFSGQFSMKLSALPGVVVLRFMGLLFILFLFDYHYAFRSGVQWVVLWVQFF